MSPSALTFTSTTWATAQRVTVTDAAAGLTVNPWAVTLSHRINGRAVLHGCPILQRSRCLTPTDHQYRDGECGPQRYAEVGGGY